MNVHTRSVGGSLTEYVLGCRDLDDSVLNGHIGRTNENYRKDRYPAQCSGASRVEALRVKYVGWRNGARGQDAAA